MVFKVEKDKACENHLMRALSAADLKLLLPSLRVAPAKAGKIIYETGDEVTHAYFPCGPTLISFLVPIDDSRTVEAAVVGNEGAVGGIVSQGYLPAYCRIIAQSSGTMLRIKSSELQQAKELSPTLNQFFSRYADCLLSQVFQSVACSAIHSIEQRTAKWLLASMVRTGHSTLELTQDQLAEVIGVGRSYIARVIGVLKERDVLKTTRGEVQIINTQKLSRIACDCDKQVQKHLKDVMQEVYPRIMR